MERSCRRYFKINESYEELQRFPGEIRYSRCRQVGRSVHLPQYITCCMNQRVETSRVTPIYKTLLDEDTNGTYAWFRMISHLDVENQDWYGNVCLSVTPSMLFDMPGVRLFFVDFITFIAGAATRIVVTKQKQFRNYREMTFESLARGDPLYRQNSNYYFAKSFTRKGRYVTHNVHLIIDGSSIDMNEMFLKCKVDAVDHSHANSRKPDGSFSRGQCLNYNGGQGIMCPSPYTISETDKYLQQIYEQFNGRTCTEVMQRPLHNTENVLTAGATNEWPQWRTRREDNRRKVCPQKRVRMSHPQAPLALRSNAPTQSSSTHNPDVQQKHKTRIYTRKHSAYEKPDNKCYNYGIRMDGERKFVTSKSSIKFYKKTSTSPATESNQKVQQRNQQI